MIALLRRGMWDVVKGATAGSTGNWAGGGAEAGPPAGDGWAAATWGPFLTFIRRGALLQFVVPSIWSSDMDGVDKLPLLQYQCTVFPSWYDVDWRLSGPTTHHRRVGPWV